MLVWSFSKARNLRMKLYRFNWSFSALFGGYTSSPGVSSHGNWIQSCPGVCHKSLYPALLPHKWVGAVRGSHTKVNETQWSGRSGVCLWRERGRKGGGERKQKTARDRGKCRGTETHSFVGNRKGEAWWIN